MDSTFEAGVYGTRGLYTGLFVPFDGIPNDDPSQDVFNGGSSPQCINQEHIWPRSEGTGNGNAERDMHHLVPTRCDVNTARSNYPFGESPDTQTSRWYRLEDDQTSIPAIALDEWSERLGNTLFEPREDAKGDVARALFYIRTMYGPEAEGVDHLLNLIWFEQQLETLYDWHYADPVDEDELERTWAVASFQEGKPNPFVIDSTLIRRAFFPEIVVDAEEGASSRPQLFVGEPYPNPSVSLVSLDIQSGETIMVSVYDLLGREVERFEIAPHITKLTLSGYRPGHYFLRAQGVEETVNQRFVVVQ